MRKFMLAAGALALVASVSAASAAVVTGNVRSVDPESMSLTLSNGKTYDLPDWLKADARTLHNGEHVRVTFDQSTDRANTIDVLSGS